MKEEAAERAGEDADWPEPSAEDPDALVGPTDMTLLEVRDESIEEVKAPEPSGAG